MNQEISIAVAFFAGFLSFLAPCILSLIPSYFAWLLGVSPANDLKRKEIRGKFFFSTLLLVLGFSVVFIILGASATRLGQILAQYRLLVQKIGGLIIILFGLEFIGFLKLFKDHRINLVKKLFSKIDHRTGSFFIGSIFAFSWIACLSPILGSILVLSSFQGTIGRGVILLSFYSLGLAIPFLLSSLFLSFLMEKFNFFAKITKLLSLFSGIILIILGILLFTDNFYKIVIWLSKL